MRDVVLVPDDFKPGMTCFLGAQDGSLNAELLAQVVLFEVCLGDVALARGELVIQLALVGRVLAGRTAAFLTRCEDLIGPA